MDFAIPNTNVLLRAHLMSIVSESASNNNKYWTDPEHNLTLDTVVAASLGNQIPAS